MLNLNRASLSLEPINTAINAALERAAKTAGTIIEATRAGELLPRRYDEPTDWHCRTCPHTGRCWR